ncbi:hypothetical protein E1281_04690 [Actinomadura sp. KC345]|uniref:hypothetical protein n=1 Tax=Actinomadura sp. KC345 TaxID=2530371 RepID=UPI0010F3BCBA|nr:hypothetical protein [Actinomadura sp. KC345]TDC57500.1 hypothetical protein E1281_04690 [Actinomadura sp. KC345]
MAKSLKGLADRIVERIVPSADAHAACLSCGGQTCVYKCCVQGSRIDMYRCCHELSGCVCRQIGPC